MSNNEAKLENELNITAKTVLDCIQLIETRMKGCCTDEQKLRRECILIAAHIAFGVIVGRGSQSAAITQIYQQAFDIALASASDAYAMEITKQNH